MCLKSQRKKGELLQRRLNTPVRDPTNSRVRLGNRTQQYRSLGFESWVCFGRPVPSESN